MKKLALLLTLTLLMSGCVLFHKSPDHPFNKPVVEEPLPEKAVWTIPGNTHPSKYRMYEVEGIRYYILYTHTTSPVIVCPETDKAIQALAKAIE